MRTRCHKDAMSAPCHEIELSPVPTARRETGRERGHLCSGCPALGMRASRVEGVCFFLEILSGNSGRGLRVNGNKCTLRSGD